MSEPKRDLKISLSGYALQEIEALAVKKGTDAKNIVKASLSLFVNLSKKVKPGQRLVILDEKGDVVVELFVPFLNGNPVAESFVYTTYQ